MASYEDAAGIGSIIADSAAAGAISAETAAAIQDLLDQIQSTGGDSAVVAAVEVVDTNITSVDQISDTAQVLIQGPDASANVTFAPTDNVTTMVVGGGGNSKVEFTTSEDVTVQLQGGENDSVATGAGNDAITFAGGSATIDTGEGNDTVVLQNEGNANVIMGAGDGIVSLQGLVGAATIDAGDGFDRVSSQSFRHDHTFSWANGRFHMHSDAALEMENVNVVTFDTDGDGTIDEITVLADTVGESMIAKLYQVALGREAIDEGNGWLADGLENTVANHQMGGFNWWTTQAGAESLTDDADLLALAERFFGCDEVVNKYEGMSNADYVAALFSNMNAMGTGTAATTADGTTADQFVAMLDSGQMTQAQVAMEIAMSTEATDIMGLDGAQYVINGGF